MSNVISPSNTNEDLLVAIQSLQAQVSQQQERIIQLESEMGEREGRVVFKNTRTTILKRYEELVRKYPAVDTIDFYDSELPKDHGLFDWNDFHYTEGMVYKAPPVLEHPEVTLPGPSKQHDHDLATIQSFWANTTRFYDSLAHEIVDSGQDDTALGKRVLDFLNLVRISAANDASRISQMRKDIFHTHLGIKVTSNREKSLLTLEDLAATKSAAEAIKKTYKKYEPAKPRSKYGGKQRRDKSNFDDKSKDHTPSKGTSDDKRSHTNSSSSGDKNSGNKFGKKRSDRSRSRPSRDQSTGNDGEKSD